MTDECVAVLVLHFWIGFCSDGCICLVSKYFPPAFIYLFFFIVQVSGECRWDGSSLQISIPLVG